jgi:hypothetical protein
MLRESAAACDTCRRVVEIPQGWELVSVEARITSIGKRGVRLPLSNERLTVGRCACRCLVVAQLRGEALIRLYANTGARFSSEPSTRAPFLEPCAGADQRDHVGCVERAPPGLCGLAELFNDLVAGGWQQ